MFAKLLRLHANVLHPRILIAGRTLRAHFVTSSKLQTKPPTEMNSQGISVSDINVYDLAKGDLEFTRNFLTLMPSLEKSNLHATADSNEEAAVEPETGKATTESTSSDGDMNNERSSGVLDKDGNPIVPIEIDGWKDFDDEEEGPTVQGNSQHIEIGNDNEYKHEQSLVVPDKREGQFEYKGIKVKLPEKASKDIGTYRFRRDKQELQTVADDMRVARFESK